MMSPTTVSADGSRVAVAGADFDVREWRASDSSLLHTYPGHTQLVTTLTYSPDSRRLASAGQDRTVVVWDTTSAMW